MTIAKATQSGSPVAATIVPQANNRNRPIMAVVMANPRTPIAAMIIAGAAIMPTAIAAPMNIQVTAVSPLETPL